MTVGSPSGPTAIKGYGTYSVGADRQIALGPIALTRAACPPASVGDQFAREVGRVLLLDAPLPKDFFDFPDTSAATIREYLDEGARDPNLDTENGSAHGPFFKDP